MRRSTRICLIAVSMLMGLALVVNQGRAQEKATGRLFVFVGSASKPAMEEAKKAFEAANPGIRLDISYGGSGTLLNQMLLEQIGDVYVPGSDDFMDKAEKKGAVDPLTRRVICWLVPAIIVPKGNPKKVHGLEDLARPGVQIGLAKAGAVCLGDISEEILAAAGLTEKVKKNVVTYALSCEDTAHLAELGEVDAIIGWEVFGAWAPEKVEVVRLPATYAGRARNIPAAVSTFSRQPRLAGKFVSFLTSIEAKKIFQARGYAIRKPVFQAPGTKPSK